MADNAEEDPRIGEDLPNEEDSLANVSKQITSVLRYRGKKSDTIAKFKNRFFGGL